MVGAERDERKVPGAFYRRRQRALVLGADAGLAPGFYLPAVRHVSPEAVGVLVVNVFDVIYAEPANLAPGVVARPAAPSAEASARAPSGPSAARTPARSAGPASGASARPSGSAPRSSARSARTRTAGASGSAAARSSGGA